MTHRLGSSAIEIVTSGRTVIARHTLTSPGAGAIIRDTGHVAALERAVLAAVTDAPLLRRKQRISPGPAAQTLRG